MGSHGGSSTRRANVVVELDGRPPVCRRVAQPEPWRFELEVRPRRDDGRRPPTPMTESAGQPPLLRLALISCGKAKLDHAAPARDLYTGGLFRAAVRHAEAEYDDYRVLSAKWHLLRPDRVIEPYDVSMADLTASQRAVWGEVVSAQAICAWLPLRTRRRIVIDVFAGQAYVDALPTRWTR